VSFSACIEGAEGAEGDSVEGVEEEGAEGVKEEGAEGAEICFPYLNEALGRLAALKKVYSSTVGSWTVVIIDLEAISQKAMQLTLPIT